MADAHDDEALESRAPRPSDLIALCRYLNDAKAKYLVIGGMAIIQYGLVRATGDIDLLVDSSKENIESVKKAMSHLPDNAVREVDSTDVETYGVVRVADEVVVDLLKAACGVTYQEAIQDAVVINIDGVDIPFASLTVLLKTKQTYREKDALDRSFLKMKLDEERG